MLSMSEVLQDVFGGAFARLSPDLQERLRQVYREGVRRGLHMEREHLDVPPAIFEEWDHGPRTEDPRRAPGRYAELEDLKLALVEGIENLVTDVELCLRPEKSLGVGGIELTKTRHQFFARADGLARKIGELRTEVRKWR